MAMVPSDKVMLGIVGAMASTMEIANPINAFAEMVDNKIVLVVTLYLSYLHSFRTKPVT